MKFVAFFVSLLTAASVFAAEDCVTPQPEDNLHLTYPAHSALRAPVQVQFALENDVLVANFEVRTPTINAKPELGPGEYPYYFDVVELFVSVENQPEPFPYYEFELSPYNQSFDVRIDDLKKPFDYNVNVGAEHEATRVPGGWKGQIAIPLKNLNWKGDPRHIVGNAYAILGKNPERSYWSLSLPPEAKPNFHEPRFFKPLLKCQ